MEGTGEGESFLVYCPSTECKVNRCDCSLEKKTRDKVKYRGQGHVTCKKKQKGITLNQDYEVVNVIS